jgi:serine phosphatase RsbU (regulator of sigma subunit)
MLLYTDGLSEAMRPESGEEFGDRQLLTLLEVQAEDELTNVRDSLVEAAKTFSGVPVLTDDCTVMIAEVR